MAADKTTSYLVSRFFYLPHIYSILCDQIKDVWGAHNLLENIESGKVWVFGAFSAHDDRLAGCCYGEMENGYFVTHLLFCRKVNAVHGVDLCFQELKKYCREQNITLYGARGYIPEEFRTAKRFARKFGCQDYGIAREASFLKNNQNIPCREFIIGV